MRKLAVALVIFSFVSFTKCAKILAVFPMPSISHQVVYRPITQELVKRGHEVVVITTDPAFPKGKAPANLTEIDVHDVGYETWVKTITRELSGKPTDLVTQMKGLIQAVIEFFVAEMETESVKEIIQKKKGEFDLLITEMAIRTSLGFSHVFKVPLIQMSSFGSVLYNDYVIGSAVHPLIYPSIFNRKIYNLTILEKIQTIWNDLSLKSFYTSLEKVEHETMKKIFGIDIPPYSELKNNIHMTILNIHPLWADNQPVPPSLIYMGGLPQRSEKPLPTELQSYMDSSKNGVIYVSFGTNSIPSRFAPNSLKVLLGVLSEVPYDVLLKWDEDQLPYKSKNIKISKWFPQSDLLKHPNVKVFITQGGLQSTDEAITGGVPLIGIPIMGDQYYNAEKYVHHKIGTKLDWNDFNTEKLKNAIEMVINDKSYRENIIKLRRIMNDQPQTPLERTIWWIEYVLRHGGAKHLKPPTANMSLYNYFEMDLIIFLISVITISLLFIALVLSLTWKYYVKKTILHGEKCKSS